MHKRNILLPLLTVALVLSLVWGYNQYSIARQLIMAQDNQYQQSYQDLSDHVSNMENYLVKAKGSGSKNMKLINFTGAWQEANLAMGSLSRIPVDNPGSNNIAHFLNQTSELSYNLAQKMAAGSSIQPTENQALNTVSDTALQVDNQLRDLQVRHSYENLKWTGTKPTLWSKMVTMGLGKAEADTNDITQPTSVSQGLHMLDSQLQKLPPWKTGTGTSAVSQEPKGLPSQIVSKEQAQGNIGKFAKQIGIKTTLKYVGDTKGIIATYRFNDSNNPNVLYTAAKRGGIPLVFDNQRQIDQRKLSPDQAKARAENYLHILGYPNMVLTSAEDHGAYMTLAYVVQEDGIKVYPDKVILRVAMDNGQLIGYNAEAYLFFHHSRSIGKTKLSIAQARRTLSPDFKVKDTSLVLLAKDNYDEVLCYEFRGTVGNEEYLDYVNASSGAEEQIYRVIKTPIGEYLR